MRRDKIKVYEFSINFYTFIIKNNKSFRGENFHIQSPHMNIELIIVIEKLFILKFN